MPELRIIDPRDYDLFKELFPDEFFQESGPPSFGRSWAFDFEKGDFVVTSTGAVKETTGIETLKQAILKVLLTARYTFGIYNAYGAGIDAAIGYDNYGLVHSDIRYLIRTALERDNRVARINAIWVTPEGDKTFVRIDVTAINGERVVVDQELEP